MEQDIKKLKTNITNLQSRSGGKNSRPNVRKNGGKNSRPNVRKNEGKNSRPRAVQYPAGVGFQTNGIVYPPHWGGWGKWGRLGVRSSSLSSKKGGIRGDIKGV